MNFSDLHTEVSSIFTASSVVPTCSGSTFALVLPTSSAYSRSSLGRGVPVFWYLGARHLSKLSLTPTNLGAQRVSLLLPDCKTHQALVKPANTQTFKGLFTNMKLT